MSGPLPVDGDVQTVLGADPEDPVLQERIELLDHDDPLLAPDELRDLLLRKRIGESQLEYGGSGDGLLHVGVRDAGGDDPHISLSFDEVEKGGFGHLPGPNVLLEEPLPVDPGVGGDVDEANEVPVEVPLCDRRRPRAEVDWRAGMVDPGGGPEDHRQIQLLGDAVRLGDHVLRLGRRGGLYHGEQGQMRIKPVVLLVLGAVGGRVVCGEDEHACRDPGVGQGHHRIRGHVEAHMLHEYERTDSGRCSRRRDLGGDLLVVRELEVHPGIRTVLLQEIPDLRGGRAGIGGGESDTSLEEAPYDGLVAEQEVPSSFR